MRAGLIVILLAMVLTGCQRQAGNPAPPRVDSPTNLPQQSSTIVIPVSGPLSVLEARINAETPRQLWTIDRAEERCVPEQRLKAFGKRVKVLPNLGCRIVGAVTRGAIRLGGSGNTLTIDLPVRAEVSARDVGGIIKRETATGAATVHATARLSLDRNWNPVAKVDIAYDWREPPGIDFLGHRISFASKADEKLKGVIAKLERDLPKELAKMHVREQLAGAWRQGFTSIQLNRERPPAWMRITPRQIGFGGYRIGGGQIELMLAAEALTETFVGDRPPDPAPVPLPSMAHDLGPKGLRFFIPVLADYRQLEPVVERTLRKLAARGITLAGVGAVDAEFGKVTIYATEGGRLAIGVQAKVKPRDSIIGATKGEIWLSAVPYNQPGSQLVRARDIDLSSETDRVAVNLLIDLFEDKVVQEKIRDALTHDFAKDYDKVIRSARKAIADRREGEFVMSAEVTKVTNGTLTVTGQGLFMPVEVEGTANIRFAGSQSRGGR